MGNFQKIAKNDFSLFITALQQKHDVFAPIKTDAIRFQLVNDSNNIYLEKNADFPIKEFFFREREKLFAFKNNKLFLELEKPTKPRVFFGVRKCDLNAIKHQDFIFMEQHKDPYYTLQRDNSILLGYHCNTAPSKYCFCGSMDLIDYYDLMFFDRGDNFLVDIGSETGEKILSYGKFEDTCTQITKNDKKIEFTNRLKNKNIKDLYDNPDWKKGVDKCISCAACTTLCPTCYCHEIKDEVSLSDLKQGNRVREWSSCQLKSFTKVAGEHVFRDNREDRFKHRIYHQLQYFKERYNVEMCVGCGRCISHCPTEIDFVEIINEMKN